MTTVVFPCGDKLTADNPEEADQLAEVHEEICTPCRQADALNREAERRRRAEWDAHVDTLLKKASQKKELP